MSDDSDIEPVRNKRKRYLSDSSNSSSGSSIVTGKRKIKRNHIKDDSDLDSDSSIEIDTRKRKTVCIKDDSSINSDSDSSIEMLPRKKHTTVISDGSSSDSSSVIIKKVKISTKQKIDSDKSDSDWETDSSSECEIKKPEPDDLKNNDGTNSDSSNSELDKCPICLVTLKNQEIGSPESCDHNFCVECILEWSKNVNTCPVDRQQFNLILVRKNINSSIVRQIPVETTTQQNQQDDVIVLEDTTYCEICGSADREDRMLLCDGCDLGYHLECLTPPLEDIPVGEWYCRNCETNDGNVVELYQLSVLLNEGRFNDAIYSRRRNNTRLMPRTRQSERVRARIVNQRSRRNEQNSDNVVAQPSTTSAATTTTRRRKKRTKRRKKYRTVYQIDPATGETISIKKAVRRRRKKKKLRRRARAAGQPKTVKKRLAAQLGICPPQSINQHLPDIKVQNHQNSIQNRRFHAGIPTLHLFGPREELDEFLSESETEFDVSGVLLRRRRRPNLSDANVLRRNLQRKGAVLSTTSIPDTADLLGSILDSQAKFHSKNSVFTLDKDGSVKVELKNGVESPSKKNNRININSYPNSCLKQTPMYPNSTASDSTTSGRNTGDCHSNSSSPDRGNFVPTSTVETSGASSSASPNFRDSERHSDYSAYAVCSSHDPNNKKDKTNKNDEEKLLISLSSENTPCSTVTPNSDSDLDIYSDIETVSTSRADETDIKPPSPDLAETPGTVTDDENNDSDGVDLVIDTEKVDSDKYDPSAPLNSEENTKEEAVTSTVDSTIEMQTTEKSVSAVAHSTTEIQSEMVQSSSQSDNIKSSSEKFIQERDTDEESEDGCPNFSIYSSESINMARTAEITLLPPVNSDRQIDSTHVEPTTDKTKAQEIPKSKISEASSQLPKKLKEKGGLYSDSEDESIIKIDNQKPFGICDIRNMTEDISEEERSYTPCLDEKDANCKQGIEGLDTEMISDEDRNDFDESHELKTVSDGDALEINAKESELDFSRPEDYEEGEIVDKIKAKKLEETKKTKEKENEEEKPNTKSEKEEDTDKTANKENEQQNKESSFKKLSKNTKERNYREKERSRSKEKKEKSEREKKDKRKEKRKEIERYDVRSLIAEKPRRMKDKFGRDETRKRSVSRSSRSLTPRRSPSRSRRSYSREKNRKRRGRSREKRSPTRSRSRSYDRKRSTSRSKKRRRSTSKDKDKPKIRKKSKERVKPKNKKARSYSRHRSRSSSPRKRRDWERQRSRDWTPSLSRSRTPERQLSPSWTPPRILDNQPVKPHNLTVILTNDSNKKRKEKKKKSEKKMKEVVTDKQKKRRRDRTPPPSKEVFASGDNILVSVSFNKDSDERDVTTTKRKRETTTTEVTTKRVRKEKEKQRTVKTKSKQKTNKEIATVKPVAIIDLERSPFRVLTPSPKDVIVLSDSENGESNDMTNMQKASCDSSAQATSPERAANNSYSMGPKTPPEPQVKFSLNPKPQQMRNISNPLHEPDDDVEGDIDPQEELEQRLNEVLHKGPNTPPEPPNSPPSSPDAYDPFDPTKSRSPTPEPIQVTNQSNSASIDDNRDDSLMETRSGEMEKSNTPLSQTPDALKSHTPPVADIQPADSQSGIRPNSPDTVKSPERISVVINQVVQSQASVFPTVVTKPIAPTTPYSSVAPTLITSTPVSTNLTTPRINIFSSTIITSPHVVSSVPQRIVLPNTVKSSPVKVSPSKLTIKPTPIKPMPTKNILNKSGNVKQRKSKTGNENNDVNLDFDSPYSPGSSDYEDLFEPPTETYNKPANTAAGNKQMQSNKNTKSPTKVQNAFDALFGTSPVYNAKNKNKGEKKFNKKPALTPNKGTKQVGVKLDEDSLKILDDLPNSAVEMQVKDKFLKKLNRQERVVEEVKLVLKPHYNKKRINKEEYKDILRRAVPKICHNKSGEINPKKIQNLIEAYVKKLRHSKKVTSSSSINTQKV